MNPVCALSLFLFFVLRLQKAEALATLRKPPLPGGEPELGRPRRRSRLPPRRPRIPQTGRLVRRRSVLKPSTTNRVTRDDLRNEMLHSGRNGFSTIRPNLLIFGILQPYRPGSPIALN